MSQLTGTKDRNCSSPIQISVHCVRIGFCSKMIYSKVSTCATTVARHGTHETDAQTLDFRNNHGMVSHAVKACSPVNPKEIRFSGNWML
eukprot:SAG11_NODE_7743_length_1101_cov_3.237525_3_plen_89_part_00